MLRVTVSVLVAEVRIVAGLKLFATAGAAIRVKVTDAVWMIVMLSVVSVAVYVIGPSATVSFTVKVATPLALLTAEIIVITELPVAALKLTVLPGTGLPAPFFKVTVMVEVLMPSAGTDVGLALTVESVGLIAVTIRLAVEVAEAVLVAVLV